MQEVAIPGGGFHRMPQGVAEVERDPAAGRAALAFIGEHDLHLGPGAAFHELGHDAPVESAGARPRAIGRTVAFQQLEQALVAEGGHLHGLAQRRTTLALGQRSQGGDIDDDRGRLVERPDEVLALRQVHRGLATDRGIDLGDKRGRDVDDRDAAQVRGREEAGGVAERPAADAPRWARRVPGGAGRGRSRRTRRRSAAWPPRPRGG